MKTVDKLSLAAFELPTFTEGNTSVKNGREDFEREFEIPEGVDYDLGNGLTARAVRYGHGVRFRTMEDHGVPEPGWDKRCLVISGGVVYFYFNSLVSKVSFSYANVANEKYHYMYKEKDADAVGFFELPVSGGWNTPPKVKSLSSERGIEYIGILSYEIKPDPVLYIDNLEWEAK